MKIVTKKLSERVSATVSELTVGTTASAIEMFIELGLNDPDKAIDVVSIIQKYPTIVTMANTMVKFDTTDIDKIEDLSISEAVVLGEAFKEANPSFLELVGQSNPVTANAPIAPS